MATCDLEQDTCVSKSVSQKGECNGPHGLRDDGDNVKCECLAQLLSLLAFQEMDDLLAVPSKACEQPLKGKAAHSPCTQGTLAGSFSRGLALTALRRKRGTSLKTGGRLSGSGARLQQRTISRHTG